MAKLGDAARRALLIPRRMRVLIYLSMVFWVAVTVISAVDVDATARLFAAMHLG